jgi:hypothetical protein
MNKARRPTDAGPVSTPDSAATSECDSREARPGPGVELPSSTVRTGADAVSGTDTTGPDIESERDSLRCPCQAQGATEVTALQYSPSAIALGESLWTINQVADYLKIPVQTLRTWRKNRTGPAAARIGRHLRYDPDQVRAWVAHQAGEAADD